ncbi:MAG: hypothetical protein WAO35_07415 [Terriglobia bacterium]
MPPPIFTASPERARSVFPHSPIAFATLRTSRNKKPTTAWSAEFQNLLDAHGIAYDLRYVWD